MKPKSVVELEEKLKKTQELMSKVIEQNAKWPGGGAYEQDLVEGRKLMNDINVLLGRSAMDAVKYLRLPEEPDGLKLLSERLNQEYSLLSDMHNDGKKLQNTLQKGESQTSAIKGLEVHLKKFIKHCRETRDFLVEAANSKMN